ncbi:hypothetical protein HPB49_007729 [Dermacentor silvarum]|uniref:Uncharacterized protein n=1 Tax=Dermacentor silvarum TaxID=543639 RepID=A0ACB8DX32_DERSI|nr:hypothetical protein HPB49_007729 [Dermacentor silvarum]
MARSANTRGVVRSRAAELQRRRCPNHKGVARVTQRVLEDVGELLVLVWHLLGSVLRAAVDAVAEGQERQVELGTLAHLILCVPTGRSCALLAGKVNRAHRDSSFLARACRILRHCGVALEDGVRP